MAFRHKLYHTLDELQTDVDAWTHYYNTQRPHSGRYCFGKTPMQTFLESKHIAIEKQSIAPMNISNTADFELMPHGMFLPTQPDPVLSTDELAQGRSVHSQSGAESDQRERPLTGQLVR